MNPFWRHSNRIDNSGRLRYVPDMNQNHASREGTSQFFTNHSIDQTKRRSFDDVTVSSIACGTYLGESTEAVDRLYEQALLTAVDKGVNFFDTAVNYRCQRSERNIGYVLKKLQGLGLSRDQFFISTKGGFLPADSDPAEFQSYVLKCFINTGLITPDDIVNNCHCMTPAIIKTLIDLSLNNLKTDCIDLYYLHNPEMQLPVLGRAKFYDSLKAVFELFEEKVSAGKIKRYGLATWDGFRVPHDHESFLDIEHVLKTAEAAGGSNHHFKAIQLPYNLAMLEGAFLRNQKHDDGGMWPTISVAAQSGVGVFASAPLLQSKIQNLPQKVFGLLPGSGSVFQKSLDFVTSTPGVISAMTGMKTNEHVTQNTQVLQNQNVKIETLQSLVQSLVAK